MKKLLIIFVIIFSSRVYAEEGVYIFGHLNCGSFLSSCDRSLLAINCEAQTTWAQGVITGLNLATFNGKSQVGEGVSPDTIKHALIKYCRDNPLRDTYAATVNIYLQLFPKAPK